MTDFGHKYLPHAAKHENGGTDELDVTGLSGELADEQDAGKIKGIEVDDSAIADSKVLTYNSTSGKIDYQTPAAVGESLVNRGDPADYDFDVSDFTRDGAWHTLDLSSIVPAGATWVFLICVIQATLAEKIMAFHATGQTNNYCRWSLRTYVSNIKHEQNGFVPLNAARTIDYRATDTSIGTIDVAVLGWLT